MELQAVATQINAQIALQPSKTLSMKSAEEGIAQALSVLQSGRFIPEGSLNELRAIIDNAMVEAPAESVIAANELAGNMDVERYGLKRSASQPVLSPSKPLPDVHVDCDLERRRRLRGKTAGLLSNPSLSGVVGHTGDEDL